MLPQFNREVLPYVSVLLENVRMCPRCLEDGFVEWVRLHDKSAGAKGYKEQDEQYCHRCNTRWGKNQCVEVAALLQGFLKFVGYNDGNDRYLRESMMALILSEQERRCQDNELRDPRYTYDTRDGWEENDNEKGAG